jgi:hypothetical protein
MFVAMTVFELQKPPEIPRIGRPKKKPRGGGYRN